MQKLFTFMLVGSITLVGACTGEPNSSSVTGPKNLADATTPNSAVLASTAPSTFGITFEQPTYTVGSINSQDDWTSLGSIGSGCALYDHAVVPNTYGIASFGAQSLRMSSAITSGCFGDQTFSKRLFNYAGETGSAIGAFSLGGSRQTHFEAQWDFASTVPGSEQPGLHVVASADRGDGARMNWVLMADTPTGLEVDFYDVQGTGVATDFYFTAVATGLDRTTAHTVKMTMDFVDGPSNDVVNIYVDGVLKHTGTSWENYFRYLEGSPVPAVNRILFRTGGAADPGTLGNGFVIDNFSAISGVTPPTSVDQCKNGGWQVFNLPAYPNQGQCVADMRQLNKILTGKSNGKPNN